mgnify:CR=1 FL=1
MKEWALMCFDEGLARVLGYPIRTLDFLLMALVVAVCVAGMQAVGLLLIVALLIIPPTSARFWSDSIGPNIWLSAIFGAISATAGGIASALVPKLMVVISKNNMQMAIMPKCGLNLQISLLVMMPYPMQVIFKPMTA